MTELCHCSVMIVMLRYACNNNIIIIVVCIFVARRGVVCGTRLIMRTRVCLRLTARVKAGPVKVINIYRERAFASNFCSHLNNFSDRDIVSKLAYRTCIYITRTRAGSCVHIIYILYIM